MSFPTNGAEATARPQPDAAPRAAAAPLLLRLRALAVAAGSGAVLSLAFPGWDAGFLAWFAMVPFLMLIMVPRRTREYMTLSLAFGFGFFGGLNYWLLAMHPLTWLGPGMTEALSLAIVFLAWSLMALVLALGAMAAMTGAGVVMRSLSRQGRLEGWMAVLIPVTFWVLMEFVQAHGTFGYSWGMLAATQYKTLPLLQTVALVGSYPLAGLLVAINAGLAWTILHRNWRPLGGALLTVILASGFGTWWLNRPVTGTPVTVAVVQGNISQTEKWRRGNEYQIMDAYFDLSARAPRAKLVVWPESALPVLLNQNPSLIDRFTEEAKRRGQYFMTGAFNTDVGPKGEPRYFNATTVFAPTGEQLGWDAKKHLVPFGEYLPWRHTLPAIWSQTFSQLNMLSVDVTPGDRPQPFKTPFGSFGANVCFDSIFPEVMRDTARAGAEAFVLVTNDGWYKKTMAMQQHLAHGVLRAVENRRPFLQAANTGASGVVDHTGRIVALAPTWEPSLAEAAIVPVSEQTPYTRFGDWLAYLLMAGALAFTAMAYRGRKVA